MTPAERLRALAEPGNESLESMRRGLFGVVQDPKGTAYRARSLAIEVAGKTGTAQVQRGPRRRGGPALPRRQPRVHIARAAALVDRRPAERRAG